MTRPERTTLAELIQRLVQEPADKRVRLGICNPHSWRGDYYELAFEPTENVTVKDMLDAARSAMGATYEGWKGGQYTMDGLSDVHLAHEGEVGEDLGAILLEYMLADTVEVAE